MVGRDYRGEKLLGRFRPEPQGPPHLGATLEQCYESMSRAPHGRGKTPYEEYSCVGHGANDRETGFDKTPD